MYQHLTIIGNLGRDPEMRYTPSGAPVTQLNIATNRTYKDNNGQQIKETTWFRVSVFGKTAENCAQYLQKGRMVLVEGRLTPDKQTGGPRIWDRQDGTKGASFEVFATNVRFMPSGQRAEGGPPVTDEDLAGAPPETTGDEEAIPF
jgi:single-strand DNA-binding protein